MTRISLPIDTRHALTLAGLSDAQIDELLRRDFSVAGDVVLFEPKGEGDD
jgi:hypothetical protein